MNIMPLMRREFLGSDKRIIQPDTLSSWEFPLAALRSLRSTASLVASRDIDALLFKKNRFDTVNEFCSEPIQGFASRWLREKGYEALVGSAMMGMLGIFYSARYRKDRIKPALTFGAISLVAHNMDRSHLYSFTPDNAVSKDCINIHMYGARSTDAKYALRSLGRAAHYIGQEPDLSSKDHVVGISYAELIKPLIRLGMQSVEVEIHDKDYFESIATYRTVFNVMNGKKASGPVVPAAAYLPTGEFVDRFSCFADA